jgi:SAM-dependent methyltransferase
MPLETFGLKSERFEILGRLENEHFWFVARREFFLGLLRQHVPQKVPVLMDLGCGYGLNLSLWGEFSEQVLGVDQHLAPETADISDRPDIIQGNVTDLSFDAQSADFALLLDTLEHVDDHAAFGRSLPRPKGRWGRVNFCPRASLDVGRARRRGQPFTALFSQEFTRNS